MDKSIEVEAKTVKEAIKIALKRLGIPKSKATIEVLREENKGLFGMEGTEQAKIRVTIKTS